MMGSYYTVNGDTMNAVFDLICRHHGIDPSSPEIARIDILAITDYCTADWSEGEEHQHWLDTASAQEIADWIISAGPQAYGYE